MTFAVDPTTNELLSVIAQVATAGGFGALVWYLIVKEIPRQQSDYRESLDKQQTKFSADLDKICGTHKEVQKAQQDECRNEIERIVSIITTMGPK